MNLGSPMHLPFLAAGGLLKAETAAATGTDKRNRNPNWTDREITRFLEMLEEDVSVMDLVANQNKKVFSSIAQKLVEEGAEKTWDQCRMKLKNLKSQYRYVKERIPNIDQLDLEDEAVVEELFTECQAKAISPSCLKHLRLLLKFLKKHKTFSVLFASGGNQETSIGAKHLAVSSASTPVITAGKTSSPPSSPSSSANSMVELTNGNIQTSGTADQVVENFSRDMMDHFMAYQRQTRESFAQWERERWQLEKESMERWKREAGEHERLLLEMFCTAMVKCNAALTAIIQAKPIMSSPPASSSISSYYSFANYRPSLHRDTGQQEVFKMAEVAQIDGSFSTHQSIEEAGSAIQNEDEDCIDDDEEYEIQQEIQNMVHVTMDVQDSEVSC